MVSGFYLSSAFLQSSSASFASLAVNHVLVVAPLTPCLIVAPGCDDAREKIHSSRRRAAVEISNQWIAYNAGQQAPRGYELPCPTLRCFHGGFRVAGRRFVSRTNTQIVSG